MAIETPSGTKEKVEKTLEEYGLVVTGKMLPEQFLDGKIESMRLQHKLDMAEMEVKQVRDLLATAKQNDSENKQRIGNLERTLFSLIEEGFRKDKDVLETIGKVAEASAQGIQNFHGDVGSVAGSVGQDMNNEGKKE